MEVIMHIEEAKNIIDEKITADSEVLQITAKGLAHLLGIPSVSLFHSAMIEMGYEPIKKYTPDYWQYKVRVNGE
jgi:hypothetical protein